MKNFISLILLALLPVVASAVNAQELTLSDLQFERSQYSTGRTMILTKEGTVLTVQILNLASHPETERFDITLGMSGGSDGVPCSVAINVVPVNYSMTSVIASFNVSFKVHGLEANSFYFSCLWYNGLVNLTEGEPLVLGSIMEDVTIDGFSYIIDKVGHTAILGAMDSGEVIEDISIPSEVDYEEQKYVVTSIGAYAFSNQTALTSITIPGSVTSIGEAAFLCCSSLTSVVIPEGVRSIKLYSFYSCVSLTSVTIPNSVTRIYEYAFADCSSLTDVYCLAENIPETEAQYPPFNNSPIASATLHVPAGSVEKYKTTSPWSSFGSIVALPIEINEENFPDEDFRSYLLRQSYGKDGVLTNEEIAEVTFLNLMAQNGHIQSLKGIEYFTELRKLICQGNEIMELDLSNNTKLEWLNCCSNNLTELDLSNNKDLTFLDCEENELTALDVSGFTKLKELVCYSNQMTTLNVSGCSSLTKLKCYLNKMTELDVSNCAKLDTIWADMNQLTELDLSNCISLTYLRVNNNKLTQIDVSKNTKLELLWCQDNQLTGLSVKNNKQLKELRTYNNHIKGERMDALIENLPIVSHCSFAAVFNNNELDVMNAAQAAAAKAKGFIPYYWNEAAMRWMEYTGEVPLEPVTFTQNQMATIILPTAPDASKGRYYRLDRCEGNRIIFEQELQPQARTPYIIVPMEDFSIDPGALDLEGLSQDAVSIESISFIGSYSYKRLECPEGFYIDIIDKTPDCGFSSDETFLIGALRAYLVVNWDDPINSGGAKGPGEKKEIVLHDNETGIDEIQNGEMINGKCFDLSGRRLSGKPAHGIFIENGKKVVK